ncbi:MAG TPA: hypothetical protein VKT21_01670 [Thermoplasmata archaeon]|nr:hypothetical protein [Thermoplasmata archaeon]
MIPPLPTASPWLPLYVLLSVLMVGGNLFVVVRLFPRGGLRPTLATAILLLGLLLMSMGLWFAGIYAVLSPSDSSTVSVFIAINSMMAVVGIWAMSLLFRAGTKHLPARGILWPLGFALLIVGNELLMGLTFVLAQVGPAPYAGAGWPGLAAAVGDAAGSAWFFWAMFVTMTFLVTWLPLATAERRLLYGFAAASLVGPWVVPEPVVGAVGMAIAMGVTFAFLARALWSRPGPTPRYLWGGLGIAAGFLSMVAGQALAYLLRGSVWAPVPFGLISFVVMGGEVFILARWALAVGGSSPAATSPSVARPEPGTPSSPLPP